MPQLLLRYAILFVLLILAQVLICNHIMLFGVAMPIVFVYFIIRLPINLNPKWVLTLSFLLGFIIDIFADTPGVNSLSCTVTGALRRPVLKLYSGNDESFMHAIPCMAELGVPIFAKYMFSLLLIYCTFSIMLEYFTFTNFSHILLKVFSSSLLSFAVLMGIDGLMWGKVRS